MRNKISQNEIKMLVRQVLNEQEQEIDDEEMNMRIHFGIKEMRDDLTVKWLTHHPEWGWLVDENNFYKDAVIGWDYEDDIPIWYSGTWEDGIWGYGIWKDGTFESGTWEHGRFHGGTFVGKTWKDGYFYGGTFKGEIWKNGWFYDGTFAGGTWEDGIWRYGIWKDGTWKEGEIFDKELFKYFKSDVNPNEYFKNKEQ
jgi:hypothetical protein